MHISGESGSGKELAARLIHRNGARRDRAVRAGQLRRDPGEPDGERVLRLPQGRLHRRAGDRDGFFQAANGGTLFLDEVADLPLPMQVKLLRAIQEKRVRKVGATQEEPVDVRIISATHQDLAALVEAGGFRQDLYYRLNVIELRMPPLRECREDIPLLAAAILARLAAQAGAPPLAALRGGAAGAARLRFPGQRPRTREHPGARARALRRRARSRAEDLRLRATGR